MYDVDNLTPLVNSILGALLVGSYILSYAQGRQTKS